MKRYSYILENDCNKATIHEFIEAKDIINAYRKVRSVIEKLNKQCGEYVWTLQNIENAYFVGIEDKDVVAE